jgi:hypothetical protein
VANDIIVINDTHHSTLKGCEWIVELLECFIERDCKESAALNSSLLFTLINSELRIYQMRVTAHAHV